MTMESEKTGKEQFATIKPVYIKNSEIQLDKSNKISDFEMYEAIHQKVENDIHCIQLERDLWRVYLKIKETRSLLVLEGFVVRNISVQVYDTNTYSTGATGPNDKVLKITICGLPLSVDDSAVSDMLRDFNVNIKSAIKYENIRDPITHRMTNVLNGNRFLYIDPLPQGKSLPRIATCAKLKCRIYHQNQVQSDPNLKCYNCWETGHRKQQCKNEKVCRVCREPGHAPGSTDCKHYVDTPEVGEIVVFQGKSNPLSNFYPCDLKVFGEHHKSAEHAYQLTKAIRAGNLDAAKKVREAATAFDAKQIGHKITDPQDWSKEKEIVMEEIVSSKAEQIPEVKIKLENSNNRTIFAEGTYDVFWGTGLDIEATLHTDSRKWPGENRLGKIYKKLSSKYARKLRNSSVPRKGTASENQSNIDVFLKDLKKGGKKNGKSDSG